MQDKQTRIIAIYGPTAVGKSRVAVEVARAIGGEIISADSMQVYRGIPIITDQPSAELQAAVPHHLVGFVPLNEEYGAARFADDARAAIDTIVTRNHIPLLVGGTGLYIRALLGDFSFAGTDADARREWEDFVADQGTEAALAKLRELDADAAAGIDTSNPRRLVRALEAAAAGEPVTAERDRLWSEESPYAVVSFALELTREQLYGLIDQRVDAMIAGGAIEEVRAAIPGDISRTVAQAIGLREIEAHLVEGVSIEDAAAAIRQKSRNYAKRQLTWMRKMPDIVRIDVAGRTAAAVAEEIIQHTKSANGTSSA